MTEQPISRFEEFLKEIDEEFPRYFNKGTAKPTRELKKIEWEHVWSDDRKTSVRIVIDPKDKSGTECDASNVIAICGLRPSGETYPLAAAARTEVLESLKQREDWAEFWEPATEADVPKK